VKRDVAHRAILLLSELANQSKDLASRHGSLLALARVTHTIRDLDSNGLSEDLSAVVPRLEAARFYRGKDGSLVRIAASSLVAALASRGCQLTFKAQLRLLDSLDHSSNHGLEAVRIASAAAARIFFTNYFGTGTSKYKTRPSERLLSRTIFKHIGVMQQPATADASRGACNFLGALPMRLLVADDSTLDAVIDALLVRSYCHDKIAGERDAETRRDALLALKSVISTVRSRHLTKSRVLKLHSAFIQSACHDFGVDQRGDVGSWSRIQGLRAAVSLAAVLHPQCKGKHVRSQARVVPCLFERAIDYSDHVLAARPFDAVDATCRWTGCESEKLCCALLRNLGDQLDATRRVSLLLLPIFFRYTPAVPRQRRIEKLLFASEKGADIPFRLCSCLMLGGVYHDALLEGLIQSAGCNDSMTSCRFRQALLQRALVMSRCPEKTFRFVEALTMKARDLGRMGPAWSVEENIRSHLPLLRCLTALVDAGALHPIFPQDSRRPATTRSLACRLVKNLSALVSSPRIAKHIAKTCAAADSLLAVLSATAAKSPLLAKSSLAALLRCLSCPFPRIRAHVAEELYARLVELSIVEACYLGAKQLSVAQTLLGDTAWASHTGAIRLEDTISRLSDVLEVEDQAEMEHTVSEKIPSSDEFDSYNCLLRDAGH